MSGLFVAVLWSYR